MNAYRPRIVAIYKKRLMPTPPELFQQFVRNVIRVARRSRLGFQSRRNFFVLDYDQRNDLLEMQFVMVHYGGFTWYDVDTMPINELHYYFNKLAEYKEKESKGAEEGNT